MSRPTVPLFAVIVLVILGTISLSAVLGILYFLSSPGAAKKANFAIANTVNKQTEPILHAFYLRSLKDPDKDSDGLEDKIAEKFIYKTRSRTYDSKQKGVSDGQYIYDIYKEAIKNNDDVTLGKFRMRTESKKGEDASLEDVFKRRGLEIYNIYIGSSLELREPLAQAQKYRADGRIKESIALLNSILVEHPDEPLVRYSIGRAYHGLRDYHKALSIYTDLVDNPAVKSPLLYADIAATNYGLGKEDLYVEYLDRSIKEFPEELEQYLTLASYFEQKNLLDKAIEVLNKGLGVEPRYAAFYNLLAIIAGKRNDVKTEFSLYQRAVAHDFRYTSGHHNLSIIHEEDFRDFENALVEERIASELAPDNLRYKAQLVYLYSKIGNAKKSSELEVELLKHTALDAESYNALGLKYFNKQNYEQAEKYFLKAAEMSPEMKNAQNNLGNVYASQYRFALAEPHYRKALEIDPLYVNAYHNLGSLFMNRGMLNNYEEKDLLEAKKWFEKALSMNEKRYDSYQSLGRIYLKLGPNNPEYILLAEKNLLRSIELNSRDGLSYGELGYVYYNRKEYVKAKENWIRAKSLGIESVDIDKRLMEIQ